MRNPAILITRPETDGESFQRQLAAMGIDGIRCPLIHITHMEGASEKINSILRNAAVQAIVVTSRNAVQALASSECRKNLMIVAVGDATAKEVHKHGFENIITAAGTSSDVLDLSLQRFKPDYGTIIHVTGDKVTTDIAAELSKRGYNALRVIAYKSEPATEFPPAVIRAHQEQEIDAVSFFSVQTALNYTGLVQKYALTKHLYLLEAFCVSAPIAEAIRHLKWKRIHVSLSATQNAMLANIKEQFYNQRI